jgi:flagellar biosynthesis GTPase FlhF
MRLIPKVDNAELRPGTIKVWAEKTDLDVIQVAVGEASALTVANASTVVTIVAASKRLHKLLSEVEKSRKAAKADFLKANKDIDELANKIALPLKSHYERLTAMLAKWNDVEERRKSEEERKRREAEEAAAVEARRQAEEEERQRQELVKRQQEAKTFQEQEQANLELSFLETEIPEEISFESLEIPGKWPQYHAPIPGAVTTKRYKFALVDPVAAYQYSQSLVRWEIAILAAHDIVRSQLENHLEPKIPGIEITQYTDVSTPSSRNHGNTNR